MMVTGCTRRVKGYQVWADALKPIFTELLGPPAATTTPRRRRAIRARRPDFDTLNAVFLGAKSISPNDSVLGTQTVRESSRELQDISELFSVFGKDLR